MWSFCSDGGDSFYKKNLKNVYQIKMESSELLFVQYADNGLKNNLRLWELLEIISKKYIL